LVGDVWFWGESGGAILTPPSQLITQRRHWLGTEVSLQLVVGQQVGLGLGRRQVVKQDDRDLVDAEQQSRFIPAVAGNNLVVLVDQDRRIEAERFDASGDCAYLRAAMLSRIVRVRDQITDRDKQELPARGHIGGGGD
jgi:hypothetical protein